MDILIAIVVVVLVLYADKKKRQKRGQGNVGRPNQQNVSRQNMSRPMGNTMQAASEVMQKNMTQTQRELKERLQKKYGNVMQQSREVQQPLQNRQMQQYVKSTQTRQQAEAKALAQRQTAAKAPMQQYVQNGVTKSETKRQENDILSRATANVQEDAVDELRLERNKDSADNILQLGIVENSELMQQVADLMITGYTGEPSFSRDFIAEGVEMLNRCETMEC